MGILCLNSLHLATVHRDDVFAVDPDSGTVTVRNGTLLDREKQAVYYLTLQATDGGNQSSSTTLHIILLDINDNKPVVTGSYNIFVQEEGGNVSVAIQVRTSPELVGGMGQGTKFGSVVEVAQLCGPKKITPYLWVISSLENEDHHSVYFQSHNGYKVLGTEQALKNMLLF